MSDFATDRNLLLGVLAVQNAFVTREGLAAAMSAWALDKSRPLGCILVEQGALSERESVLLEDLVAQHLARHHDDPQQSLTAIKPPGAADPLAPVREAVRRIPNTDVQASLEGTLCRTPGSTPAPPGNSTSAASTHPAAGAHPTGPRFCILRPHARGGLGQVFVARDEALHRDVALKEIQREHADDPESRARFLLEAEVTGRLEHPGIVPVYGLGTYADGRPFYAMRFIQGDSLKDAIARFHQQEGEGRDPSARQLALRQLLGRFVDVCNAVAYAHSRGILHRDLKPANVMLGPYGETLVVDWGLAKVLGEVETGNGRGTGDLKPATASGTAPTQMGRAMGTPAYMSPEQAAGRLDKLGPASDVYSLGATLYHLLTGRAPWQEEDVDSIMQKVQRGDFPPPRQVNGEVPPALEAVCLKAMARAPEGRYSTPRALADDLERWLAEEPVTAYREPLRVRAARWRRRHPALVTGTATLLFGGLAALAVGGLLLGQEQARTLEQQRTAREAQVSVLFEAAPQAVPALRDALAPYRDEIRPLLQQAVGKPEPREVTPEVVRLWRQQRARAALALLAEDRGQIEVLTARLLEEGLDPAEMLLVRDALKPHAAELKEDLWRRAGEGSPAARFRALVALAAFDPRSERWGNAAGVVVGQLVKANSLHRSLWTEALRPVRGALAGLLGEVFRGKELADYRQVAAEVLADHAADQPQVLAYLLLEADNKQFAVIYPKLKEQSAEGLPVLSGEIDKRAVAGKGKVIFESKGMVTATGDEGKEKRAKRQALAGVALLHLGKDEKAWPLLRHTQEPEARAQLVSRMASYGVDALKLVRRLELEKDTSARRALLVALGDYDGEQLPAAVRGPLVQKLLGWYRDHPDPGIHGAIDWLLRHGKEGPTARPLDWGQAQELQKIDEGLKRRDPDGVRGWYVNKEGQTLVLVPESVEFRMGSSAAEPGHRENERLHRRQLGRSYAIASKAVTVAQFERFLKDHADVPRPTNVYAPEGDCPILGVSWYMAAQYCNWLSEQEGIPEEQWCYPKHGDIKEGMKPYADYLQRKGYRLATEAEWEYTCRAGSASSRYYGSSVELLGRYAWYQQNSKNRSWPVGQKRPNDLGLFDMQGNAWTWVQDGFFVYPQGRAAIQDKEDIKNIKDSISRVLRGGSFFFPPVTVRSAFRYNDRPDNRVVYFGLRVARTYD